MVIDLALRILFWWETRSDRRARRNYLSWAEGHRSSAFIRVGREGGGE